MYYRLVPDGKVPSGEQLEDNIVQFKKNLWTQLESNRIGELQKKHNNDVGNNYGKVIAVLIDEAMQAPTGDVDTDYAQDMLWGTVDIVQQRVETFTVKWNATCASLVKVHLRRSLKKKLPVEKLAEYIALADDNADSRPSSVVAIKPKEPERKEMPTEWDGGMYWLVWESSGPGGDCKDVICGTSPSSGPGHYSNSDSDKMLSRKEQRALKFAKENEERGATKAARAEKESSYAQAQLGIQS